MNSNQKNNSSSGKPSSEPVKASTPSSTWNDHSIELIIGNLLRAGVLLSASVVTLGGIVHLARHGRSIADYRTFHGDLSTLRTVTGIFHGTLHRSGSAIIQFGLLLLIATPIARVIFSAVAFARERDFLYVAFTLAVLAVLAYSLLGSSLH
jgi:uncharacterized membrane protein